MPCLTSTRRWSVSKLVTPRWRDQPLVAAARQLAHRIELGRDARTSTNGTAAGRCARRRSRVQAALDRRRARRRGVIGPGVGHHLVKAAGRRRGVRACRDARVEAAGDDPPRCRSGRPCRSCRSRPRHSRAMRAAAASRSSGRPSRSMSATCHRPVTTRLIVEAGRQLDALGPGHGRAPSHVSMPAMASSGTGRIGGRGAKKLTRPAPARSARPATRRAAARNSGPGSGPCRPGSRASPRPAMRRRPHGRIHLGQGHLLAAADDRSGSASARPW